MVNKEERDQKLEELAKSIYGKVLLDYIEEIKNEIDSVEGANTVKEIIGRQEAIKKLDKIFRFLTAKREEKSKEKNQYT